MNINNIIAKKTGASESLVNDIIKEYYRVLIMKATFTGAVQTPVGTYIVRGGELSFAKTNDSVQSFLERDIPDEELEAAILEYLENRT